MAYKKKQTSITCIVALGQAKAFDIVLRRLTRNQPPIFLSDGPLHLGQRNLTDKEFQGMRMTSGLLRKQLLCWMWRKSCSKFSGGMCELVERKGDWRVLKDLMWQGRHREQHISAVSCRSGFGIKWDTPSIAPTIRHGRHMARYQIHLIIIHLSLPPPWSPRY